jgi:endonuclease/exonuclease/phosphatase family metal-dependent hydrolase
MIVSSYNVRGLGGVLKRKRIRDMIRNNNIDFLALQETKLEEITDSLCYGLWGSHDCEWVYLPSELNSVTLWRN